MDDALPVDAEGKVICMTGTTELWPAILEKAVAKFFGSYAALDLGDVGEALELLTGLPCESDWDIIGGATCGVDAYGLARGRTYVILEVKPPFLKLKAPVATTYTGPWHRDASTWTPRLRTRYPSTDETFWMHLDDAKVLFDRVYSWPLAEKRITVSGRIIGNECQIEMNPQWILRGGSSLRVVVKHTDARGRPSIPLSLRAVVCRVPNDDVIPRLSSLTNIVAETTCSGMASSRVDLDPSWTYILLCGLREGIPIISTGGIFTLHLLSDSVLDVEQLWPPLWASSSSSSSQDDNSNVPPSSLSSSDEVQQSRSSSS